MYWDTHSDHVWDPLFHIIFIQEGTSGDKVYLNVNSRILHLAPYSGSASVCKDAIQLPHRNRSKDVGFTLCSSRVSLFTLFRLSRVCGTFSDSRAVIPSSFRGSHSHLVFASCHPLQSESFPGESLLVRGELVSVVLAVYRADRVHFGLRRNHYLRIRRNLWG